MPSGSPRPTAPPQLGSAEESALAAIVLSSQDAVIAKTTGGIVTAWNAGATTLYGYTADRMLGQCIELMMPESALAEERERLARMAAGIAESGYRCVRIRADGRPIEVVMSMSPIRDRGGCIAGVATISRPVGHREVADSRLASFLEVAPDAMLCVDPSGRIVHVNAQAGVLFGYPPAELAGEFVETLLPAELADRHRHHRRMFMLDPRTRSMGARLALRGRRRDGSMFPVAINLAADSTDGDTLVIAAVRDVTEQQAIEAALRESQTRLRQLAEHVDTVFTLRTIHPPTYLYVSPSFFKLSGIPPGDLITDPDVLLNFIHPDDRRQFEDGFLATTAAGLGATSEHRVVRADGEVRWVRAVAQPVLDPGGHPERMVTTTDDITERVSAAEALRAAEATARTANAAKNEFLSRMSHELRTPLNAVLGFGQLLEHHLQDTEHAEAVRHVLRAGHHLLALINEVLDLSRIESGDLAMSPEPVAVRETLEESTLLMRPIADAAGVRLAVVEGPEHGFVLADRQRLRQVLLNLLSNAIKYNHRGGCAWVSWASDGDRATVTVRDDGPGIPAGLHGRLFAPFDRLGAERTGVEGTGVGLTVTQALVGLMKGTLTFQSEVGHGSSFTVSLPLTDQPVCVPPPDDRRRSVEAIPEAETGHTSTLLYIEDNEPNVRVMESLLKLRPSWLMIHAALGSLGIELAQAHQPEMIILDLHLPDGSGADVLRTLRSDSITARIPVVILSADASPSLAHRLMAAGASAYLTKPMNLDDVLALLDQNAESDAPGPRLSGG